MNANTLSIMRCQDVINTEHNMKSICRAAVAQRTNAWVRNGQKRVRIREAHIFDITHSINWIVNSGAKGLKKYGKICSKFAMDVFGKCNRYIALNGISQSNALFRLRLRLALKSIANSLQILPFSFITFFIFSQWPLKFGITKFNTSLYRFLLKVLKIVGYSSIVFLVSFTKFVCWAIVSLVLKKLDAYLEKVQFLSIISKNNFRPLQFLNNFYYCFKAPAKTNTIFNTEKRARCDL